MDMKKARQGEVSTPPRRTARVLVADDEPLALDLLKESLSEKGYHVETARDGVTALRLFQNVGFDLVLSDVKMPRLSGLQLLEAIKEINPRTPVILVSGVAQLETAVQALKLGAENFLAKPLNMSTLERVVEQSLNLPGIIPGRNDLLPHISQSTIMKLPSRRELVSEAVYQISLSAVAMGFAQVDLDNNLKLALVEAITNAMEHGNCWDENKLVELEVHVDRDIIETTIKDQGQGFNYSDLPDPTQDPNLFSERGRGIFLIKAIMDEVIFTPPGNSQTLIKKRAE